MKTTFDWKDRTVRRLTVLLGIAGVCYAIFVVLKPFLYSTTVGSTDPTSDGTDKANRQASRGQAASMLTTLLFSTTNAFVDMMANVDSSTSTALIGMLCGNTYGFVLDNALGSDEGFELWKKRSMFAATKYGLGALASDMYLRYIVTVLFDMFLTMILYKPLFENVKQLPYFSKVADWKANLVTSMIAGTLTFGLYTNMTRFQWAYPPTTSENEDDFLASNTMLIATSIAAMAFLGIDTQIKGSESGTFDVNNPRNKLLIVLGLMVYVFVANEYMRSRIDHSVKPRNQFQVTSEERHSVGDTVMGAKLASTDPAFDPQDEYVVVQVYSDTSYRVFRKTPKLRYFPDIVTTNAKTAEDVLARGWSGFAIMMLLTIVTGGVTVLLTGKTSLQRRVKTFAFFVVTMATLNAGVFA
jgi:hypothetical protein